MACIATAGCVRCTSLANLELHAFRFPTERAARARVRFLNPVQEFSFPHAPDEGCNCA